MLIQRMTTRYIPFEDRVCLMAETDRDVMVHLWLTRRLLDKLLPPVFRWLEKITTTTDIVAPEPAEAPSSTTDDPGPAGVRSETASEEEAGAEQKETVSVQTDDTQTARQEWLVSDIKLAGGEKGIRLIFQPAPGTADAEPVTLVLETRAARQWIVILYRHFRTAGWSVNAWPAWLQDSCPESASVAGSKVLH